MSQRLREDLRLPLTSKHLVFPQPADKQKCSLSHGRRGASGGRCFPAQYDALPTSRGVRSARRLRCRRLHVGSRERGRSLLDDGQGHGDGWATVLTLNMSACVAACGFLEMPVGGGRQIARGSCVASRVLRQWRAPAAVPVPANPAVTPEHDPVAVHRLLKRAIMYARQTRNKFSLREVAAEMGLGPK